MNNLGSYNRHNHNVSRRQSLFDDLEWVNMIDPHRIQLNDAPLLSGILTIASPRGPVVGGSVVGTFGGSLMHDIAGWSPLQRLHSCLYRHFGNRHRPAFQRRHAAYAYRLEGAADERPPLLQLRVSAIPGPGRLLERIASWH